MINPLIYRPLIVLCVGCFLPQIAHSQLLTDPSGSEQWMLGGSSAAVANVFSARNNAAGITEITQFQTGIYNEQRFTESHLQASNLCVVLPTQYLHVGASIHYVGYSAYNQKLFSLSAAKKLSATFSLGVQLNYVSTYIQDFGSTGNPVLGLGLFAKPIPKLTIGFVVFNPTQATYGKNTTDHIPTYARLGCGYKVSEKVSLNIEADQSLHQQLIWRVGIYYRIHQMIHLGMGAATNPSYYTFGTALTLKNMKVDMAVSLHEVLGFTPHLGLSFPITK
jgi:hypothetical protein